MLSNKGRNLYARSRLLRPRPSEIVGVDAAVAVVVSSDGEATWQPSRRPPMTDGTGSGSERGDRGGRGKRGEGGDRTSVATQPRVTNWKSAEMGPGDDHRGRPPRHTATHLDRSATTARSGRARSATSATRSARCPWATVSGDRHRRRQVVAPRRTLRPRGDALVYYPWSGPGRRSVRSPTTSAARSTSSRPRSPGSSWGCWRTPVALPGHPVCHLARVDAGRDRGGIEAESKRNRSGTEADIERGESDGYRPSGGNWRSDSAGDD